MRRGSFGSLAMSIDGRMLAAGSNSSGELRLWEVATGRERDRIAGHESRVVSMAFSPDSRYLAASSRDAPVYIWDVYGREPSDLPAFKISPQDVKILWQQLADSDPARAFK